MKAKFFTFILVFVINGFLYGVVSYLIDSGKKIDEYLVNIVVFGAFMAVFNVMVIPKFKDLVKRNKT